MLETRHTGLRPPHTQRRTRVIGLGNPLLGDDGFGWQVATALQHILDEASGPDYDIKSPVEVDYLSIGGLRLMEFLAGCDTAILVDAITTGQHPAGYLYDCALDDLPQLSAGHMSSTHDTSLQTALRVGRTMGVALPDTIWVIGVEIEPSFTFNEALTPLIQAAVPCAVDLVIRRLHEEVL